MVYWPSVHYTHDWCYESEFHQSATKAGSEWQYECCVVCLNETKTGSTN